MPQARSSSLPGPTALNAALFALPLLIALAAGADQMPSKLTSGDTAQPLPFWVSEQIVLDQTGGFDKRYFTAPEIVALKSILEIPAEGPCIPDGIHFIDRVNPPDRTTLSKAVRSSSQVVLAKITGEAAGFRGAEPGTLFGVSVEKVFRGVSSRPEYYFFFPVGTVHVGKLTVCKTDPRYPALPKVGDEVILMAPLPPDEASGFLELWNAEGVITLSQDGKVDASEILAKSLSTLMSRDELISKVERFVRGEE